MRVILPVTGKINDSMRDDEWICSKTDLKGIITYANDVFCRVAGFKTHELVGQPHNLVRHPDMPCIAFAWCWDTLGQGKEWRGQVKNRCKNGDTYWVDVTMTPQHDHENRVTGYFAVRRRMTVEKINEMDALYKTLADAEGSLEVRAKLTRAQIDEMYRNSPLYALAHPSAGGGTA
ncbi:MAG: PAS domain-containing protein [Mariprofundales bacterium]